MKIIIIFLSVLMFCSLISSAQTKIMQQEFDEPVPAKTAYLPLIFPTPVSIELGQGSLILGKSVTLIITPETEIDTENLLRKVLKSAGVETIHIAKKFTQNLNQTCIILGTKKSQVISKAISQSGTQIDEMVEGYTISAFKRGENATIILAGQDSDGLFHAVQTFSQLSKSTSIPALVIKDHPSMRVRGTIEGFYGKPWSMEDRKKHLNFLSSVKANTYIYSPKDDPYARDRWRETYPEETLTELGKLVETARLNHINFVYAISPGPSICFSDPMDLAALERKFEALRSIGVHSFYVALDDIEYTKWNCVKDNDVFGPSGAAAAAKAQSKLLNALQSNLIARDPKANPLIMVPTEYYDAKESPYKAALRANLDPMVVVQWTGTDVVPPSISINDARSATKAFGRKTLLWDNYPVNDYAQTAGRLLLAPYLRREAGVSAELTGILSNPMNQEAPSRIAVTGVVSFGWNDKSYNADLTWRFAARELTGGDENAANALVIFFDTQHIAPTFGSQPWQEQSPKLKAILDDVREAMAGTNAAIRKDAISKLVQFSKEFTIAPDVIRSATIDPAFAEQSRPWLDAMQLWGRALQLSALGLQAANRGNPAALKYFANSKLIAAQAAAIKTIPGATRFDGTIKIADGVLDDFVNDAPNLIRIISPDSIKPPH